jgi:hypothetical protein
MNKLKKKLLTKWFFEWLGAETDVETLEMTKVAIEQRRLAVAGPIQVIGFRQHNLEMSK